MILSYDCRNKNLQCYDWWEKLFWLTSKKWFNSKVNNIFQIDDNIQKIAKDQGDDYTSGCLQDYNYFKIKIELRKQQALNANSKAIQQIHFTGNLSQQAAIFFIIEKTKEAVLYFLQGTVKVF